MCVCVFVSVYVKMWLVHIVEEILDSASQNGVFLLIIIINLKTSIICYSYRTEGRVRI